MIWVVTDHHPTRQDLVPLIVARGYEVEEIDCGDEVPKRVRFRTPSLVILDCGMNGSFDTLASIRAESRQRRIPVVMFSNGGESLREKALMKGADAFVQKGSLDWAELLIEVARFVGPPRGGSV
jgi:two-component system alkaline phosphatase synthesis response regulator PhoP